MRKFTIGVAAVCALTAPTLTAPAHAAPSVNPGQSTIAAVSQPPLLIRAFLNNTDPGAITTEDAIAFTKALDSYFTTADGTGANANLVISPEPNAYWVTNGGVLGHRYSYQDMVTRIYPGGGKPAVLKINPRATATGGILPREYLPIPKAKKIEWAVSGSYDATCLVYCSYVQGVTDKQTLLDAERTESSETGVITWTLNFVGGNTVVARADMGDGLYEVTTSGKTYYGNTENMRYWFSATAPEVKVTVPSGATVASTAAYERGRVIDDASYGAMEQISAGLGLPTAKEMAKAAGKSYTDRGLTLTVPKKPIKGGVWLLSAKSTYLNATVRFYYSPSTRLMESVEYRG